MEAVKSLYERERERDAFAYETISRIVSPSFAFFLFYKGIREENRDDRAPSTFFSLETGEEGGDSSFSPNRVNRKQFATTEREISPSAHPLAHHLATPFPAPTVPPVIIIIRGQIAGGSLSLFPATDWPPYLENTNSPRPRRRIKPCSPFARG